MTIAQRTNTGLTLTAIGMLYLTQGIPMGLAFLALPAILRNLGISADSIGMIGLVILPWSLKIFWAPFIDRFSNKHIGGRRYFIILAQLLTIILYFFLIFLSFITSSTGVLLSIIFLINLVCATQDIATDGWVIELLKGPDLAWANGLQISGFALGMLLGGSVTLFIFTYGGWSATIATIMLITLFSIIPVFLVKSSSPTPPVEITRYTPSLRKLLQRKDVFYILSVAGLFYFSNTLTSTMTGPFLIDRGFSLIDVGNVTGIAASATIVVGGIIGGWLTRVFNVKKVAVFSSLIAAISLFFWWFLALLPQIFLSSVLVVSFISGLASGISYVAFFTLFMHWSSLKQAGTDFTATQCMESWTNSIAAIIAGQITAHLGFKTTFLISPVLGLIFLSWIAFVLFKKI